MGDQSIKGLGCIEKWLSIIIAVSLKGKLGPLSPKYNFHSLCTLWITFRPHTINLNLNLTDNSISYEGPFFEQCSDDKCVWGKNRLTGLGMNKLTFTVLSKVVLFCFLIKLQGFKSQFLVAYFISMRSSCHVLLLLHRHNL